MSQATDQPAVRYQTLQNPPIVMSLLVIADLPIYNTKTTLMKTEKRDQTQ